MAIFKALATAAALSVGLLAAAPSAAVITTFASFNAVGNGNVVFQNNGTGGTTTTYRSNGRGGALYTTNTPASVRPSLAVPGSVATTFSFLQPSIAPYVSNVAASFTFYASVLNSPVTTFGGFDFQQNLAGTFSFLSSAPITIGATTYAAGSNLLSGTFNTATILGPNFGTSGSALASVNSGASIAYTSDFLNFAPTVDRDMSLSLTAINSLVSNVNRGINFVNGRALRSFRGTATGSFSTDPAPIVTAVVPEPEVWGLMLVGFGMVGLQVRRRARQGSVAA